MNRDLQVLREWRDRWNLTGSQYERLLWATSQLLDDGLEFCDITGSSGFDVGDPIIYDLLQHVLDPS